MRLLIAGANGRTGRLLVRLALEKGHTVTGLYRAATPPEAIPNGVTAVTGDALDPASLAAAVAGQDAVISVLSPRPRTNGRVYVEGTRNLADAAVRAGVLRFLAVSAEGAGVDARTLPLIYRLVLRLPVMARLYPDIARMERELMARTDLDWTVVAPAVLTDEPATGEYRVGTEGVLTGGLRLSREDLAAFLLQTAATGSYVHERVVIAR
jgi:putative NADH-flavin reductase